MTNKKRLLAYLLSICFFFSTFMGTQPIASAAPIDSDRTITGSISLPDGALATEDMYVDVFAVNDNGTPNSGYDDIFYGGNCVIASGQNSAAYTVLIPSTSPVAQFAIRYRINSMANYYWEGYYRFNTMTIRQNEAYPVDVSIESKTDVNLTILKKYTISGTVSRPEGVDIGVPIDLQLSANEGGPDSQSYMDDLNYGCNITIPGGATSATYEMSVPYGNYTFRYFINQMLEGYIREGFYSVSGTTANRMNSSNLSVTNSDIPNIDLTLLSGNVFAGIVSVPEGYVDSVSGSAVSVFVWSDNGTPQNGSDDTSTSYGVLIPYGSTSAPFSITVPKSADGTRYVVGYNINMKAGYLQQGYYHPNGTVAMRYYAAEMDSNGGSRTGIILTIIQSHTISGTVSRPDASSSETINVQVNATDEGANPNSGEDNLNYGTTVTIPAGVTTAHYEIAVANGNYIVSYNVNQETNGFLREGFYSDNGTRIYYNEATLVSVNDTNITEKNLTMIPGKAISGTVYLPNSEVAPSGGIQLDVHARFDNNNGDMSDDYSAGTWVNIPAGANSGNYYITVPDNALQRQFTVSYQLHTDSSYLRNGFYNSTGTVNKQSDSEMVDVSSGNRQDIDITLMKGYLISGTIYRPDSASMSSPIMLNINATDEGADPDNGMDDINYGAGVTIPAEVKSVNYSITVPAGNYKIRYWMNQQTEEYLREGFLGSNETTSDRSQRINVTVTNSNVIGKDLTLLTGKFISGTISLPDGAVAPSGGLQVNVNVWSNNGTDPGFDDISTGIGVMIPEGSNSVPYSVTVPGGTMGPGFTVRYYIENNSSYLNDGYYTASGIVFNQNIAEKVNVSNGSRSGINLAIPGGYAISGTISRPAGVSTAASVAVQINACNEGVNTNDGYDDLNFWKNVTIPAGVMTQNYQIAVPVGNYKVRYMLNEAVDGIVREGYFSDNGTLPTRTNATLIAVTDGNIAGKNITMIPGRAITGTITLPNSATAPEGGLQVNIIAQSNNGTPDWYDDFSSMSWVTIQGGTGSAVYSVTVPFDVPTAEYRVNYRIDSDTSYLREGYYSTGGTIARQNGAGAVTVMSGNATGINLDVLNGYVMSGTISRPDGADTSAPVTVDVNANDQGTDLNNGNDDLNFGTRVTIPAEAMSANYEFVVAAGNYVLNYWQDEALDGYIKQGFYTNNGTNPIRSNAVIIPVTASNITDKTITLIPGSQVTGTISLPNGDTAPEGGIELEVRAWSDFGTDNGSDDFNTFRRVTIPAGQNSTPFTLMILKGETLTYRLSINTPSNSEYTAPAEKEFTAEAGVYTNPINLVLNKSQLNGRVVDPVGETISYGYVEIKEANGDWIPGVGTDQSGNFTVGGLADGSYILRAFKWDSVYTSSLEARITISQGKYVPDSQNNPLTLYLTLPQITGTVYNANGNPVNGGNVELRDRDGMWIANTNIRNDGSYSFGGLSVGAYVIKAYPYWESTEYTPSKDEIIVVTDDSSITYDLTLTVPQITGTVLDGDGDPAMQGWVEIYNKMTGMGMPGANIVNGSYSFGGLSDGVYVLRARPEAGTTFTASEESEITITAGEVSNGNIHLAFRKSQLVGTILDPYDQTTEYGWVEIRRENGDWIPGSPANRNGQFTIGGLDDGDYIIKAYPNGGVKFTASQEEMISVTGGIAVPSPIIVQLTLPQISGILVTPEGTPLRSGHIEIRKQNGEWINGVGVDYEGYFAIGGLPEGTYFLKAYPNGNPEYCVSDEIELTIVANQPQENIVIALNSPQLSGSVMNPDGTAAFYGNVDVYSSDGRWVTGSPVNQNGLFSVGSLKDGTYEMKAYPDWRTDYCASEPFIITIQDGVYTGPAVTFQLTSPLAVGTVMNPDGTGSVRYGWIEVKNYDTDEWLNGYNVNESGSFSIGNLANGTYSLRAMADQNSPYANSEEMIIMVLDGSIYDVNGAAITNLQILLTQPKINGQVVAPDGVSGTRFGWIEARTMDGRWVAGGNIDYNGNFRLGNLGPAGTYIIKAYPSSYDEYTASRDITVEIDDNGTVVSADPGVLENGMLTIRLSEVQLKGIVTNPADEPALYGWVEVQKDMGDNRWEWINCFGFDWNGGFKLGGLADGVYRLRAFPDQRDASVSASEYYTITVTNGAVVSCDITGAYTPETNTISMKLSVPQLIGRIVGPNDEAVSYGWVEVRDINNEFVTGIGAGKNGEFAISGLAANQSYKVIAYPSQESGFTESREVVITTDANGTCSDNPVNLKLSDIQVAGHVTTPDGQPVSRGWVEIYLNGAWVASSGIDENGTYKFGGLQDGQYTILAYAEPGSAYANSRSENFEIAGGTVVDTSVLELALTTPQTTGIVYLPGGITNAKEGWVEIGDAVTNWLISVPIAEDGTFKLPAGLANGSYTIQAFPAAESAYGSSDVLSFTVDGNPNALTLILK